MEKVMRLNSFQRLMRLWTQVAPYNAGTLLRVAGPLDRVRWQFSVEKMVTELGLGRAEFIEPDRVRFLPVEKVVVEEAADLQGKINAEMNRAFTSDEMPMRFFICPGDEQSHYFGLMVDHWLTDGGAVAELIVRLCQRYAEPEMEVTFPPHRWFDGKFEELFGRKWPAVDALGAAREGARIRSEHREVASLKISHATNWETHFLQRRWSPGLHERAKARAQSWGGSVHDLLLAITAHVLAGENEEISLASVADIRAEAVPPVSGIFGQFISFYTNVLERPQDFSLADLTRRMAEKNRRAKEEGKALRNLAALEAARVAWEKAETPEEKAMQFHQLAPLVAAVSHMNVTRLHRAIGRGVSLYRGRGEPSHQASPLLDATVLSPTGPLTPLLITVNKLRTESVMMGLSYRTSVYARASAETLLEKILEVLTNETRSP